MFRCRRTQAAQQGPHNLASKKLRNSKNVSDVAARPGNVAAMDPKDEDAICYCGKKIVQGTHNPIAFEP